MFSHRPSTYPRSWREMSLEFKSMFAYHIGMMVMFMVGGLLSVPLEVGVALTLAAMCVFLSLRHRRQVGWRWPGVSAKDVLLALVVIVGGVIFLTAATPMFFPLEPYALPWYLAGIGIVSFNVLTMLQVITYAESDFIAPVTQPVAAASEATPGPAVPRWHALVRTACVIFFVVAWLDFMAFFYVSGQVFQHGSATPTATQTKPMRDHGTVVYVTPDEKARVDLLEQGQVSIPVAIGLALFAHVVLGVKIISNLPTRAELRQRAEHTAYAGSALEGPVKVCANCGLRNIPERHRCKRCGADLGETADS
jgi:hypothetical protein